MIEVKALKDVCTIIAGQSPPSDTYNQEQDGVPFFQGKADFGEIFPTVRYWCNAPKKISQPNDILFSLRAPVGPTNINNIRACIGRGLAAIRCNNVELTYVLHYLRGNEHRIAAMGTGSTFKAITIGTLKDLEIPLPPLEEQKKIAAILDAADDYRQKTKALIEKYDQLTQSLFLSMFGDPVTNPKGWKTQKLKKNIAVLSGFAFTSNLFNDEGQGVPIIRIRDVGKLKTNTYFSGNYKPEFVVNNGDLIIGMDGDFRLAEWSGGMAILNQRVCRIKSIGSSMDDVFLKYWLPVELKRIEDRTSFATVKHLSVKSIQDIDMPVIPEYHRIIFKDRVATLEKQKQLAEASLVKAEELFNSLLQRAFKGELTN